MAIQDTPVRTGPRKIEDTVIPSRPAATNKSEKRDNFEAVQAAFLDDYLTGSGVYEAFAQYSNNPDKESALRSLSTQKAQEDVSAITEEFVSNPYGETGSIDQTARAVYEARVQANKRAKDPDTQFAETLVGDTVDTDKIDREGFRAGMYKILSDMEEDITLGDTAMDWLVDVVPFVDSIKGYNLTGSYFGQDDDIKRAIAAFQNKSDEEQARMFPHLVAELQDKVGEQEALNIARNFLAPMGAENPQEFGDLNRVFDAIDVAGFAPLLKAAFKGIKGSYNVAKSAKELGNDDLAVETSLAAAVDEDVARSTGMDQTTATGNLLPYDTSIEDIGHSKELSGKAIDSLAEFFGRVDETAQDIMQGKTFLKEGILGTKRRAELEEEARKKLKAENAENIRSIIKDENETVFEYEIRDADGNVTTETYNLALTLNDAGSWDQSIMSLIGEWAGSPTAWAKGTLRDDVNTAQRIDFLSSRINRQLTDLTREAMRPIGLIPSKANKESLAKVDKALREGDEWKNADGSRGIVFSPEDLRRDYGLEENEISSYYRINRLYNNIFNIRNHEKRQEMLALGYKDVKFERSGEHAAGKAFNTSNDAALSIRQSNTNYVYDADADEMVTVKDVGEGFFSDLYAQGKRIVRLQDPYDAGEGRGKVFYTMVSEDAVSDLPQVVLQRKKGYVPRIYENNAYFVKEIREELVDGDKTFNSKKTLRFFDNKKDADTYREQLIAREVEEKTGENSAKMVEYRDKLDKYEKALKRYNEGKRKTPPKEPVKPELSGQAAKIEAAARNKYKTLEDREEEILSAATGDIGHGSGGLYTGARAQDDILFGLEGTKPERLNSFESLTRNIGNISKFASINQWRLGLEQRWINTANDIFKAKGIDNRIEKFERLPSISEASDEVRFLNRMYDQVRDWQGFATAEERAWNSSVQKLYDFAMNRVEKGGVQGYGYKKAGKLLGNLKGVDPVAAARASAFHSLLGWFNFSQLWVQAQGAMVAYSLGAGKYASRVIADSSAFAFLDTGGSVLEKSAQAIAKASGRDVKDLTKLHELWKKTGYRDSVLQTADHAAVSKGYGMTSAIFRKMADEGLIFYRMGELTNRRMSFNTAIQRWLEKNGTKTLDDIDDDALRDVMDDANNMMLNMTKANRANWQKGVLSLPFQFLQVTTKFLETAIGFNGNFTGAERGRLIASQLVLYGTAGVPLAGLGTKYAMEALGVTQQDIEENPGLVKTWNDGFWGATTHWVFGADIEVASRGSLLRGISDTIDTWFVQESQIQEKLLGAFGSTATRFWDSLTYNLKPFMLSEYEPDWADAGKLLVSPFLDTVSTWNNVEKAILMEKMDAIYSRNGRVLDTRDYSWTEELAQGMGFQQTPASETWDLITRERANENIRRKITDYVMRRMNDFANKYPSGGYPQSEYTRLQSHIQGAMAGLDEDEKIMVREAIQQSMASGSRRTEAMQSYMRTLKENAADELSFWGSTIIGNKVLRIGTEEQE